MTIIRCLILSKNINTGCLIYQNKGVFSLSALLKVGVIMFLQKRQQSLHLIRLLTTCKCSFYAHLCLSKTLVQHWHFLYSRITFFLLFECLIGLTQVTFLSVRMLWTARLMFSALSIHSLTQGSCKTTCGNKYSQPALLSHFLPNRSEQEI